MTIVLLLVPAVVAAVGALLLARSPLARRLRDQPNERSLHSEVTPRVGGLALLLGALPVAALQATPALGGILATAAMLALVSAIDDAHSLPVLVRLPAHVAAALVAVVMVWPSDAPMSQLLLAGLAVCAVAWMTNLFNFMDGSDGLAGAMAIAGFGALGYAAWPESVPLAWACIAVATASAGFLAVNHPPARLFLGDAGAIPLGFLAGALGLAGFASAAWPWWFPVVAFFPFILDASITLLRRLVRGVSIWRAHREHAYQRLVMSGWSKRRLAWVSYAAMTANACAAIAALRQEGIARYVILMGLVAAWLLSLAAIERRCRNAPMHDQETPASGIQP